MTVPNKVSERGEFRQDIITGKWSLVAPSRDQRPSDFAKKENRPLTTKKYIDDCPFCNLGKYPQEPDVLRLPNNPETWQVHIFGNKYPALTPAPEAKNWQRGLYRTIEAVGYHEILATRYHNHHDFTLSEQLLQLKLEALVLRFRELKSKPSVAYIQIINNRGPNAGGSLEHPHHQIFTTPVIPSDILDLLRGTEDYVALHKKNPFDVILEQERQDGHRLVYSNDHFTAFCPYASRQPFAITILPHAPQSSFDQLDPSGRASLADSLRQVFGRLYAALGNIDYNYYIYSAPCDTTGYACKINAYPNFRWHIEILPRLNKLGGFEIGTGLEIITMYPEKAAEYLRDQKLS